MRIILPINNDSSKNSNKPYYLYVYHLAHLRKTMIISQQTKNTQKVFDS